MPKINGYCIKNEIQKPNEVYELKKDEYKIPTFEEFMKSYEADEKVNYVDLENRSVGEVKGYGPCGSSSCTYSSSFHVKIRQITDSNPQFTLQTYFRAGLFGLRDLL